jgi:hypothetical protein
MKLKIRCGQPKLLFSNSNQKFNQSKMLLLKHAPLLFLRVEPALNHLFAKALLPPRLYLRNFLIFNVISSLVLLFVRLGQKFRHKVC